MKNKPLQIILLFVLLMHLTGSCIPVDSSLTVTGVSRNLAEHRKENISGITYNLFFSIPENIDSVLNSSLKIEFYLQQKEEVILDFKPSYTYSDNPVSEIFINGRRANFKWVEEHLIIPVKYLDKGKNIISLEFIAGDQSLNRREEFMYTLLVPDRARTLFPCFDQPDLKANYELSLEVPAGWDAVANGKIKDTDEYGSGVRKLVFSRTEPISTYLFSFVAGDFKKLTENREGREVNIWHRETDSSKIAQTAEIFSLIYSSLEWLEEYTGIKYPFSKYDIVILPGFQYGGMEHMGATLYADRTMFLENSATITEELARAKLIAHETAHMWFGDYVTMEWFNDVWTKEVFANWFASAIVSPLFEEVDHKLNFINTYFPASYAEDRTAGANPVQQELDNLHDAGLVYGNIIYNKAPIVMDKLAGIIGDSLFREGIRKYLNDYAYGNASWDNLIDILDNYTEKDLKNWSDVWIKEAGRANLYLNKIGDSLLLKEVDPSNRGLSWGEDVDFELVPDPKGEVYGLIIPDSLLLNETVSNLTNHRVNDQIARLSAIINLYELTYRKLMDEIYFLNIINEILEEENNPIIFSRLINYLGSNIFDGYSGVTENILKNIYSTSKEDYKRSMAFKVYVSVSKSTQAKDDLFQVWSNPGNFKYVNLGERDLMNISYKLSLLDPDLYDTIKTIQIQRLSSTERVEEFKWIYPSLSPSQETRDSVFNSLLKPENRTTEPWSASALTFLNHTIRSENSVKYIKPALEKLEEVHYTGDIFFPARWCSALLEGHSSENAAHIVRSFLDENKDENPLLLRKILQQSQHLFR